MELKKKSKRGKIKKLVF